MKNSREKGNGGGLNAKNEREEGGKPEATVGSIQNEKSPDARRKKKNFKIHKLGT